MMKSYIIAMLLPFFLITIFNIILNKFSKKLNKKISLQHYLFGYLFILYLIISLKEVVGFPCFSEWQRFSKLNTPIFNPNINLIPFSDGFEISAILNIIFFMPFGFLLPTLWQKFRKFLPTLCYGLIFSMIIEFGQLFTNGRGTDITDLIMNSLGTILGWLIFKALRKVFLKLSTKTVVEISNKDSLIFKLEPYIYVAITVIATLIS